MPDGRSHRRRAARSTAARAAARSLGRLHTKLTVVDDERTFVGSMNMDPRSARLNTEAGIVIHSAPLARLVAKFLRARQELASYKVQQQGDRLGWLSRQARRARARQEPQGAGRAGDAGAAAGAAAGRRDPLWE